MKAKKAKLMLSQIALGFTISNIVFFPSLPPISTQIRITSCMRAMKENITTAKKFVA